MRSLFPAFIVALVVIVSACREKCPMPVEPTVKPPTPPVRTKTSSGFLFDGLDDYIHIPHYAEMDVDTGDYTFEGRIKADCVQVSYPIIMSLRGSEDDGFLFGLNPDGIPFVQLGGSTGNWYAPGGPDLRDNEWHYVAITKKGGMISYFVDGDSITAWGYNNKVRHVSSTHELWVGLDAGNPYSTPFKGIIAQVRYWSIYRPGKEIRRTMDKDLTGNETGLIGDWDFRYSTQQDQIVPNTVTGKPEAVMGSTTSADSEDPFWVK